MGQGNAIWGGVHSDGQNRTACSQRIYGEQWQVMMAGDEPVRSYAGSGSDLLNGHFLKSFETPPTRKPALSRRKPVFSCYSERWS